MVGKNFEGANYLLEKNWGGNTILRQKPLWFMAFTQNLESQNFQAREDLKVNLVRLTHVTEDGTEKQRFMSCRVRSYSVSQTRQMKCPDSQAKALSPHQPPAHQENVHRPQTQASYLLSEACGWALYRWHLLWQISVTMKGDAVNTRWQILKLGCFHKRHFLRGERPFSGSLKTSGFPPAQHPRTSSHNRLLWKCHYSILKRLEQLHFLCNSYVFWKRGEKSRKPGMEKLSRINHVPLTHQEDIKLKLRSQIPCQRWNPPTSVTLLWPRLREMSCCPFSKTASNSPSPEEPPVLRDRNTQLQILFPEPD